jgi:hypothetical protein
MKLLLKRLTVWIVLDVARTIPLDLKCPTLKELANTWG